jgi:NAD(P)-dependent dehydrogenase (short-subunit alcohol dehydrogenase family)
MTAPVALITGALTGIGRATAEAFAREGYRVVVSGRRQAEGEALAGILQQLGAEAEFVRADVRHEEDVKAMLDATIARFGRIDVAVNNAGTEGTPGALVDQTAETYAEIFDTNVLGVLLSLKHELKALQAQGEGGAIINVSSIAGHVGFNGAAVYVASKHAVEGLTKTAALEGAAYGVRVNAIAPGPIETGMLNRFANTEEKKSGMLSLVPLARIGTPDEVARAILHLASPKVSFITGQSLAIDGGLLAA